MLFSLTTSQNLLWKLRVKMTHLKHLAHIKTEFNPHGPHVMKQLVAGSTSLIKIFVFSSILVKFSDSTREMDANVENDQNEKFSFKRSYQFFVKSTLK